MGQSKLASGWTIYMSESFEQLMGPINRPIRHLPNGNLEFRFRTKFVQARPNRSSESDSKKCSDCVQNRLMVSWAMRKLRSVCWMLLYARIFETRSFEVVHRIQCGESELGARIGNHNSNCAFDINDRSDKFSRINKSPKMLRMQAIRLWSESRC